MALTAEKISITRDSKRNISFLRKEQSKPLFFQPKLTIDPADNMYEQKADAVTGTVLRMSEGEQTEISPINIQRKSAATVIQRQEVGDDKPLPIVVPILTSPEVALPCPDSVNSIVPEFIREAQERSVIRWNSEHVMSPTRAQVAEKAFQYLGEWRQRFPAEDPRNPTDSELAIASAEHYCFARHMVASGEYPSGVANAMIEGYTFIKDQLSHAKIEWVLSLPTNGVTPTKATRCQNDWAHKGVNDGLGDWAADHP
ncbi:MAG TPA: hypothetical protein VEW65_06985 [Chryseolinea sp.]|nr:hypothetical protein [Chryseolinea sp.]